VSQSTDVEADGFLVMPRRKLHYVYADSFVFPSSL